MVATTRAAAQATRASVMWLSLAAIVLLGCGESFIGATPGKGGGNQGGSTGSSPGGSGGGSTCDPTLCPGSDSDCQQRSCDDTSCGFIDAAEGTACDDGADSKDKVCDGSGLCVECNVPSDCTSGVCDQHHCVAANCTDKTLNGDETDVDCGGSCTPCENDKTCKSGPDCASGYCKDGKECKPCEADDHCPEADFCDDEVKDKGVCKPDLEVGGECNSKGQCKSGYCVDGYCCDKACEGLCEACSGAKTGKAFGSCEAIPAGNDPDSECALNVKQCEGDFCSGTAGACGPAPAQAECRAKSGSCDIAETCDGVLSSCPMDEFVTAGTDPEGACGFAKLCDNQHSCAGFHKWGYLYGGSGYDVPKDVAVATNGDAVITGQVSSKSYFGGTSFFPGSSDVFVARYDSAGKHVWSTLLGAGNLDYADAVAVDTSSDEVVVAGSFTKSTNWGGANLSAKGNFDAVLAKLNKGGQHSWSLSFGGDSSTYIKAIAIDPSGNIAAAGYFFGQSDYGSGGLTSAGLGDVAVARYDKYGAALWSKRFGGTSTDSAQAVAVDSSSSIVVVGYYQGTADFGGGALPSFGGNDGFVAKYDKDGQHQWSKHFGGTSNDTGLTVAVGLNDSIVVGGTFYGTADFGGGPLTSNGSGDAFLIVYDKDGNYQWSQGFGGTSLDQFTTVAVEPGGDILSGGAFYLSGDFGGGMLNSNGSADLIVVRHASGGGHLWSKAFGSTSVDSLPRLAISPPSGLVLHGGFGAAVDLGGGLLNGLGSTDVGIAMYEL